MLFYYQKRYIGRNEKRKNNKERTVRKLDTQSHDIRQIARDLYPNYDQLEPLGHGGMGDLFKGRKRGLDVPIVVKIIKTNLKGRLDERQEAEILKGLKHKYLPRIYDVIENKDGYLYTIMDYIPGENLKEYVKRTGVVDQKTVYRWAQQLCEVVAYLHEQTPAIIHSDIKPGNVMITPGGDICLIDFNTSMEYRAGLTAIGKTKGYAAPEQYTKPEQVIRNMQAAAGLFSPSEQNTILTPGEDNAADETVFLDNTVGSKTGTTTKSPDTSSKSSIPSRLFRSSMLSTAATKSGKNPEFYGTLTKQTDVYAIGATLYFALTGMAPPHALEQAKPLSTFRLPVSRSMVQIIDRSMEKNPKDRFCDAAEMGKAFRDIHRLDGNYRKARLLTITAVFLEMVLLVGGIALMTTGSARLCQEQATTYIQLLNDAQKEKSKGNYDEALELTAQAQTLMDTRMEAYVEEAAVYYDQAVHAVGEGERKEYFKHCVTTVQEILQADLTGGSEEEWAKVHFVGAESCVELENYSLAQKWYRRAIQYVPTSNAYRGLICSYTFDGNTDEAIAVLEEMQTVLEGADREATYELVQAELCYLQKDYFGAVEHYKKLFGLTNDEALLRWTYLSANNACIYGGNALLSQGISFLEEACERLPSAWGIYKPLLANSYYTQAYLAEEERSVWLDKALDTFEDVAAEYLGIEDRLTMNQIRIERKKLKDAETDLLAMKELHSKDYRVHMRLSHLYLAQYAATYRTEYRTKAEEAYRTAKNCYEESGVIDPEMIAFISSWQQYVKDEG